MMKWDLTSDEGLDAALCFFEDSQLRLRHMAVGLVSSGGFRQIAPLLGNFPR